jgi:hypothetical protein
VAESRAQDRWVARQAHPLDDQAVLAGVDRVFVTAHPAEPTVPVLLRAGDVALRAWMAGARAVDDVPAGRLRRLMAERLRERLPADPDGELHAAVTAAAVVAALELAFGQWLAAGASPDDVAECRARWHAVALLLPPEP